MNLVIPRDVEIQEFNRWEIRLEILLLINLFEI